MITLTLCLMQTALPQVPGQQPQQSIELFSLRPYTVHRAEPPPPLFGTMMSSPQDSPEQLNLLDEWQEQLWEADDFVNLVQSWNRAAFEDRSMFVNSNEDRMLVQADAVQLEQLRRNIRQLFLVLGQPIEITASIFLVDDARPTEPVLHADQLAELQRSGQQLWSNTTTTRSSLLTSFDALRWSRYVRDVEVEVAQNSKVAVPMVDVFAEGLRISVLPHSMVKTEDIAIQAQFSIGDRRGLETLATGVPGHPNIDLPRLESAFGAVAARVPSGGGMAVLLAGTEACGARLVLVISPRYPSPRQSDYIDNVLVAPVSALTNGSMIYGISLTDSKPVCNGDDVGDGPDTTDAEQCVGRIEGDELEEVLLAALDDSQVTSCELQGGFLLLSAPAEVAEQARTTLTALQDRLVRNAAVHCSVDASEVESHSPMAKEIQDGEHRVLHRVALPCLAGRTSVLFRGIEQNSVRTMMCEIAQDAHILDPVVERLSSGLWTIACPSLTEDGVECDLTLQFDYQTPTVKQPLAPAGMLMLSDSSSIRVQSAQLFTEQPIVVATGTTVRIDQRFWRPRLMVSCR